MAENVLQNTFQQGEHKNIVSFKNSYQSRGVLFVAGKIFVATPSLVRHLHWSGTFIGEAPSLVRHLHW